MPTREAPAAASPADVQAWIRRRAEADAPMQAAARSRDAAPREPQEPGDTDILSKRAAVGRKFLQAQRSARRTARTRASASKD